MARNTDRRAQGNRARPSGQDPSARLGNGLAAQSGPTSRAARTHPRTPRPRRNQDPSHNAAATPARDHPQRSGIFTPWRPSPGCDGLGRRIAHSRTTPAQLKTLLLPTSRGYPLFALANGPLYGPASTLTPVLQLPPPGPASPGPTCGPGFPRCLAAPACRSAPPARRGAGLPPHRHGRTPHPAGRPRY